MKYIKFIIIIIVPYNIYYNKYFMILKKVSAQPIWAILFQNLFKK